jgi:hypothetical protein
VTGAGRLPGSAVLAALALAGGLVVGGCSDSPTCDDLESLNEELANTDADDPGYNDLVSQAKQAEADCNKGGGY